MDVLRSISKEVCASNIVHWNLILALLILIFPTALSISQDGQFIQINALPFSRDGRNDHGKLVISCGMEWWSGAVLCGAELS